MWIDHRTFEISRDASLFTEICFSGGVRADKSKRDRLSFNHVAVKISVRPIEPLGTPSLDGVHNTPNRGKLNAPDRRDLFHVSMR